MERQSAFVFEIANELKTKGSGGSRMWLRDEVSCSIFYRRGVISFKLVNVLLPTLLNFASPSLSS
jgi:hypothetical protein